jgi:Ca2+-binding RTX toxin-like protein
MRALLLAVLCLMAAAPAAGASTLEKSGTTITYTAALGEVNDLAVEDDGSGNFVFDEGGTVSISTTTCTGGAMASAECGGVNVNRVVINLRDEDDDLEGDFDIEAPMVVDGGTGVDDIEGSGGPDDMDGGADGDFVDGVAGNDVVRGGDGSDVVRGNTGDDEEHGEGGDDLFLIEGGADDTFGGPGFDTFIITDGMGPVPGSIPFSLDDVRNDGLAPFFQNLHSDVEAIQAAFTEAPSSQQLTLTGSDGPNSLTGGLSGDTIDGRGGVDLLSSYDGNDTVLARDGGFDLVFCGVGTDSAVVDSVDDVRDCENVDRAAPPPPPPGPVVEDRAPTVGFVTPIAGAVLDPSRANAVTVNAADDRGIARVLLFDDGRLIGADAVAPYAFTYAPTADDVGRNTLVAIAVDTAQQTATDQRATRLGLFTPPRPTAAVSPTRDRSGPYRFVTSGRVRLPPGVTQALGCSEGEVSVQVKRGRRTISNRRVNLRRTCTFQSTVTFADRSRLGNGRLTIVARFLGNDVMRAVSAPTRAVRAG